MWIKNVILIFAMCSAYIFFSIINILGIKYNGANESNMYIVFCVLLAVMSLLIIFFDWGHHRFRFNKYQYVFLCIPILITFLFIKEYTGNSHIFRTFQLFLIWSVVSLYIGIYYAKNKCEYNDSIKYWMLLMWFLSIGTIKILFLFLLTTNKYLKSIDGYQTLSYTSALAYSLNLFFILYKSKIKLFPFCSHPVYKILSIVLLALQVLCVFISGGRGGFVVIVFSSIILFCYGLNFSIIRKKTMLIFSLFTIIIVLVSIPFFSKNELIKVGVNRVFSYISSSGIDMKQTSYRDIVYNEALIKIKNRPLFGHGVFRQMDYMGEWMYPHNFFLEILLGGGIVYLLFILLISYIFYKRMIYLVKLDISHVLLLSIFSFTFVLLMFSGTYLSTPFFWFLGSYVFSYPTKL